MTVIAVLAAKRSIISGWAPVSIHVDRIVDRSWRSRWSRRCGRHRRRTTGCEGKVLKATVGIGRATGTCASVVLQPADIITAPIADSEDHLLKIVGHSVQVIAVTLVLYYFFSALSHRKSIATELAICLMEVNFDVEFLLSIDSSGASRHKVGVRATASHLIKKI